VEEVVKAVKFGVGQGLGQDWHLEILPGDIRELHQPRNPASIEIEPPPTPQLERRGTVISRGRIPAPKS
jgi:hypothetical protein